MGKGFVRKPPKRVDYLLRFTRNFPLAVVEAKASYKSATDAVQQARDYAEILDLKYPTPPTAPKSSRSTISRGRKRAMLMLHEQLAALKTRHTPAANRLRLCTPDGHEFDFPLDSDAGAPPKHDWDAFAGAIARRVHDHGMPVNQGELVRDMMNWFAGREDFPPPDERTVRRKVSAIWKEMKT